MLDLRASDHHVAVDRRVGPDIGVRELCPGADDGGAPDDRPRELGALLDRDSALDPGLSVELAVDPRLDVLKDETVGLEHVLELSGVLPPALDDVRLDAPVGLDQGIDRVGDLELATGGRLDRVGGREDRGREHVDADQSEVAGRVLRLLDQPDDTLAVELRHTV